MAVGVSLSGWRQWEQGVSTPRRETFTKLTKALGDPQIEKKWFAWVEQKPTLS
ncbi:MAG: helix-turn-helix transcriptional regulator [Candidatus Tectomicrobia bacterium]|nr:helix-turn-helix transcriptional regulator [Candidatus Tectomicrobia bacterium]